MAVMEGRRMQGLGRYLILSEANQSFQVTLAMSTDTGIFFIIYGNSPRGGAIELAYWYEAMEKRYL